MKNQILLGGPDLFANRVNLICSSVLGRPELFIRGLPIKQNVKLLGESYNNFARNSDDRVDDESSIITVTTPEQDDEPGAMAYQKLVTDDEIPNLATIENLKPCMNNP